MEIKIWDGVSDEELVRLALAENSDAYSELVIRWMKPVIGAADSVTRNVLSAEDIAQEVFLTCWFKLSMLKDYKKFGAWACRAARNQALNFVMQEKHHDSLDVILKLSSQGSSPETNLLEKEMRDEINDAFDRLPAKVRETGKMHYLRNFSQKQIALILKVPEGTVRRRLFDVRNRLKSEFEKLGIIETPQDNKCTGGKIMTQEFVAKVNEKINLLKEQVGGTKFFHLGESYKKSLSEAEKLVDSMEESDEKHDALIKLYYYQTYIDASDEAFEKAFNAAYKANDLTTIRNLVTGVHQLNREPSEKLKERIERILPMFEGLAGYGDLVFWYAQQLMYMGDYEESKRQFRRVTEIFNQTESSYYPNATAAINFMNAKEKYGVTDETHYKLYYGVHGMMLENKNGRLTKRQQPGFSSFNDYNDVVLNRVDWADVLAMVTAGEDRIYFTEDMNTGDKIISDDGKMSFEMVSDNETVAINSGVFTNCHKFIQRGLRRGSEFTKEIWYCPNVGLVKVAFIWNESIESYELDEYSIFGGSGLFPLEKGNSWKYKLSKAPDSLVQHIEYIVEYMDRDTAFISTFKLLALKRNKKKK